MGKRGPQPWQPTDEQRRLIEHYVAIGYTQEQIAELIGIAESTLKKHCSEELKLGGLRVNAKIGGKLFQKAMGGDTTALIFWAKTRMGWKETTAHEHTGKDGSPIKLDMSNLTDEQLAALEALDAAQKQSR